MSTQELVMALPASLFKASEEVQPAEPFLLKAMTTTSPLLLMRSRAECEVDEALRQPIPYIMLSRNVDGRTEYLVYERAGGEGRLHGKLSVGIGGHVNPEDCYSTVYGAIMNAARRELIEECGNVFGSPDIPHHSSIRGLIVLEETPVDRVHVGVLFVCNLPSDVYEVDPSTELLNARWVSPECLRTMLPNMESWSQVSVKFVLEHVVTHVA